MVNVSILFFATGILTLGFAWFVPAANSVVTVELFDHVLTYSSPDIFKVLGVVSLVFGLFYRYTESLLYSWRWSVMHWVCFLCLVITIWTLGVLEQVWEAKMPLPGSKDMGTNDMTNRLERIRVFYSRTLILLAAMQLSCFLNLGVGVFHRNSQR